MKIFFGAAPGVGKTYEMLLQARRRRLDGVDVVIGVVETHGRVETELLTKGLDAVPKRRTVTSNRASALVITGAVLPKALTSMPATAKLSEGRPEFLAANVKLSL